MIDTRSPSPAHTAASRHTTHSAKSKSISSLPQPYLPSIHRLTPSTSIPGPSSSAASIKSGTLSRSSSLRSKMTSPSRAGSFRSKTTSPSRLPATDSVSYFPPFEAMGSDCGSDDEQEGESPRRSATVKKERRREPGHGHAKGRSLGSIAGMMSASLSWGLSSLACTSPPTEQHAHLRSTTHASSSSTSSIPIRSGLPISNTSDGDAVEALTRKFTPGKRRVLEPFTVHTNEADLDLSAAQHEVRQIKKRGDNVGLHKRRMRSEFVVEEMVLASSTLGESLSMGRRRKERAEAEEDDVGVVEALVDDTPSRPNRAQRRLRPTLQVPTLSFPNWRFPLPSPPVTCLSPDIPLDAFKTAIENPCSSTSTTTSPHTASPRREAEIQHRDRDSGVDMDPTSRYELDEIDDNLSPSPTTTTFSSSGYSESQPATPPKERDLSVLRHSPPLGRQEKKEKYDYLDIIHTSPNRGISEKEKEKETDRLQLTRTNSAFSNLSCETVKPRWTGGGEGEVTPKATRVWSMEKSMM
ncbi:hypothetical protein CI109_106456 [Kwoniella shandongensis]|uniref:Uncharacterized protein n=1 Tax=Kwoniella shandongensis TaxID=1734106 RepID=A0A5M6C2E2_9TREE|nr:uncharacterized protein CI109_002638 [Kwoniella shandongensis]KAA5528881.1 hypothetical protein CI109_002638 [Kwoniella shandongensis]